jgi:cell fate regulator YaaT (PSP1 superfamily)
MRVAEFLQTSGPDYPFSSDGKVLRPANPQDFIDYRHLENSAREEAAFCRKEIRQLKLGMKLVTVEHLLGGERIIFFFSSENRVDFRELVRLLASQYRTRIEMRQVGARDEARLVGDYERCGRNCCCQGFLKDLHPVSMRMAKTQKATLDPTKISGRCGRLMCCLRYEDAGYEELRAKLPRKNTFVRTGQVVGKVIDGQILTQLVRLLLPDGTQMVVGNDEILERDVPAPPPQPMAPTGQNRSVVSRAVASTQAAIRQQEMQADSVEAEEGIEQPQIEADDEARREEPFVEALAPDAAAPAAEGQRSEEGGGRRRRRRRRRGGQHRDGEQTAPAPGLGGGAPPQASVVGSLPQAGGAPQGGGESSRRHRGRRRRR